jgi:hypothetical protein
MEPKKIFSTFILVLITALLLSCESEKASLEDLAENDIAQLNDEILEASIDSLDTNLIQGTAAIADTWDSWDEAYISCFKDQTFRKNKIYLGPSNTKYLGVILSKDKVTTRRTLQSILPAAQFDKLIIKGAPVNTCDLTKVKNISLDIMLSAAFQQMDDSLKTSINRYDSIKIVGGEWQIDELIVDDFLDLVNGSTDPALKAYRKSMLENKNYVITKVVKVTGFAAEIYSTKKFGVDVSATLEQGKVLDVVAPDAVNAAFKLTLSKQSDKVVKVSSSGQFYIYGVVLKGKKL